MEFSTGLTQQTQEFFDDTRSFYRLTLGTDSSQLSENELIAEVQDQFKTPCEMAFSQRKGTNQ